MIQEFLIQVVAPLMADEGGLDRCYATLEQTIVALLLEKGLSAEEIAAHLGRSRGWVYGVIAALKEARAKPDPLNGDSEVKQAGLKIDVMACLASRRPAALSVREISETVHAPPERVVHVLEALKKLAVIECLDGRYRSVSDLVNWREREQRRAGLLSAMIQVYQQGSAYLAGRNDILCQRIMLDGISPQVWARKLALLREVLANLVKNSILESQQANPDGIGASVQVKGFICLGEE